ncbi:MAG: hypothetical protein ACYTGH_07075 [Planctomycetota bacterium]|jgi:hypothetical protein
MSVGSVSAAGNNAALIQVLKASQQAQVELVEKLITTGLETQVAAEEMQMAEQLKAKKGTFLFSYFRK